MWGTVLVFALIAATEPARMGIAAFLVSCPRPMLHLLAYWLGLMASGVGGALVALFLLRDFTAPVIRVVASAFTNPVVPFIQIALGVVAFATAVTLAVRSPARQPAPVSVSGGEPSATVALEPKAPTVFSRLSWSSLFENKSAGMAFVAGLCTSTQLVEYWGAIMVIMASEAAAATQVGAVVMWALVAYAVIEIPLISHVVSPTKTQLIVERLHTWMRANRRPVFAFLLGAVGVFMVANGVGAV